jgi:mono/diheme cytochrome c family protein
MHNLPSSPSSHARGRASTPRSRVLGPASTRARFYLVFSLGLLAACGAQDAGGSETQSLDPIGETPDQGDGDSPEIVGDASRGKLLADKEFCASCHTQSYAGSGYYANITQDEDTGIGAWSDEEIANAIVHGVGDNGDSLCELMPRSELSDAQVADVVAYLRTLPAVKNEITRACPGHRE